MQIKMVLINFPDGNMNVLVRKKAGRFNTVRSSRISELEKSKIEQMSNHKQYTNIAFVVNHVVLQ